MICSNTNRGIELTKHAIMIPFVFYIYEKVLTVLAKHLYFYIQDEKEASEQHKYASYAVGYDGQRSLHA